MNGKYSPKLTPIRSSHFAQQLGRTNSSPAMLNQIPRGSKIDPQVYTDTQSKGLSSRIVLYYDRNHREPKPIINRLYNRAGEFPVVHMKQNTAPTHRYRRGSLTIAHSSPQIKIPAPEESLYQSCTRSEILRTGTLMSHPTLQDAKQLNLTNGDGDTLAPLDALKEISRKRIHCDHIDADANKKQKPEVTVVVATPAATGVSTKRQRDTISPNTMSNFGGAQKKRPCTKNNDILSSLSSSLTIITPKRKKEETCSGHQLSFQSESQPSIHKHRRNDTVDYNETLVSRPQQKPLQQDNVLRQPVENDLTTPPPYNKGFVAIQRTPTTPTVPKLTLFNKAYVPNAKRTESPIDNLNTDDDDDEDDEPKISYVQPKKCINATIGTNTTKPPVEKTKLALMLSCLSGDLDDFDTIDAPVTVTPAPTIPTPVSTAPIETKLPTPIVSMAEPAKSTLPTDTTTNTIHTMPSIRAASVLLTSPIKFTIATDTATETPPSAVPSPQRKGGFAFSPDKPDAVVSIPPAIPTTASLPSISFTLPKPATSTVIVSPAAAVSPPRFAPSIPPILFGANKPTTATTTPETSSVAPNSFAATTSFGANLITGISSFTASPATTVVTPAAAPVFSFGKATAEPSKAATATITTPSFGITKVISSQQAGGTNSAPAFQSVASVAFGSSTTAFQPTQPPTFGSANSSFSKPTPSFGSDPKATTTFGTPTTTAFAAPVATVSSQSNSSTFTFGGGMTTQAKISSFATATTDKPISFGAAPTSSQSSSSPSFGVAASSSLSFGAAQTTSPFSGTAASSFGSNQFSAPQKSVGFGSGTASTATPSFGDAKPFGSNTSRPSSTFGTQQSTAVAPQTSSNGMFGQQQNAQIRSFAFGGSSAAPPTTTTSTFSFSGTAAPVVSAPGAFSSVPATTSSSAFSFGGVATAQPATTSSTFAFGGPAASTPAATSSFGFNKPTASSGPFSFGGGATATSTAPKPSISSFNSSVPQTAAPPSFNSAQTAASSFSFSGNQTSQTVAPTFGGSMSFGGVSAQQPTGSSSTFSFGGNNTANTTNTQNVAPTSFSFSAQQSSASSNNMFGTPATATPSHTPAPFAFGGSGNNSDAGGGVTGGGAFNFSAQPQQSPGGNLFTAGPSSAPKGRVIRQASRRINK